MPSISQRIAEELSVRDAQVAAAIDLLDGGATVPFVARYRKEATGGLDDGQLRQLEERLRYLRELEERRSAVLASIDEQGKLDDALKAQILAAETKQRLEDLYLPYKPKRRTKAQIAREAGLEPLADALLTDPTQTPELVAERYLNPDHQIDDVKAALDGAKQILMERFAEDAELVGQLRQWLWQEGVLTSRLLEGQAQEGAKFRDYFEHDEAIKKVPSHRALAMFRGRNEGVLSLSLKLEGEEELRSHPAENRIAQHFNILDQQRPADRWLAEVVRWTWKVKLYTHLETELLSRLRESAEIAAIEVFAANLKDLLLAAPAGPKATLGLDPGLRTGVKVAVVDATGKVLDYTAIYPHAPKNQWQQSIKTLTDLCRRHQVELIAIGNGTASRETDKLAAEVVRALAETQKVAKVMVNEAGASVYSASEFAAREFPELDVTIRGAVSIARRLQDPLAELVKIDPKSIGVGQYQHDVSQVQLARSLDAVVEDCVNAVGVDLNTASVPLLTRVSGLNTGLAENIIQWRDSHGAFNNRQQLLDVSRLGPKTFEQCAGFLRIMQGDNPLDASAVHPETYSVVEAMAKQHQREVTSLIGDSAFIRQIKPADYATEQFGTITINDILKELDKPGRDPRPEFRFAEFQDGVETLKDLEPGMILEGAVTNVTHFGAFVDIGVHQDGLVHISALSEKFVEDPRQVVKAGDIVKVKVMSVDIERKRVGLSMRMSDDPNDQTQSPTSSSNHQHRAAPHPRQKGNRTGGSAPAAPTLGDLFKQAQQKRKR